MARRGTSGINCLIAVDKPAGCTSHDVVARVRHALDERRVGHAGTLDPMATGVMVLGIGQATRLLGELSQDTKSYITRITFGQETNTDDAEGEVVRTAEVPGHLADETAAREALSALVGDAMQVPPAFSAISVKGVRAYKAARAGEEIELEPRPVTVHAAELVAVEADEQGISWTAFFTVSKGTYIRALARDLGRALGSAAYLSDLRRTASGTVGIGSCARLDDLSREAVPGLALDPIACLGCPALKVEDNLMDDVLCGRVIPRRRMGGQLDALCAGAPPAGMRPVGLVHADKLVAVAETDGFRVCMRSVFPDGIAGVRA